jgi:hypothetical protein
MQCRSSAHSPQGLSAAIHPPSSSRRPSAPLRRCTRGSSRHGRSWASLLTLPSARSSEPLCSSPCRSILIEQKASLTKSLSSSSRRWNGSSVVRSKDRASHRDLPLQWIRTRQTGRCFRRRRARRTIVPSTRIIYRFTCQKIPDRR